MTRVLRVSAASRIWVPAGTPLAGHDLRLQNDFSVLVEGDAAALVLDLAIALDTLRTAGFSGYGLDILPYGLPLGVAPAVEDERLLALSLWPVAGSSEQDQAVALPSLTEVTVRCSMLVGQEAAHLAPALTRIRLATLAMVQVSGLIGDDRLPTVDLEGEGILLLEPAG